jgi:hypothetical protein
MHPAAALGLFFVALAVIFVGVTVQNYLQAEGKLTPARQAWLRIAFIFAGIGIILYAVQLSFW